MCHTVTVTSQRAKGMEMYTIYSIDVIPQYDHAMLPSYICCYWLLYCRCCYCFCCNFRHNNNNSNEILVQGLDADNCLYMCTVQRIWFFFFFSCNCILRFVSCFVAIVLTGRIHFTHTFTGPFVRVNKYIHINLQC